MCFYIEIMGKKIGSVVTKPKGNIGPGKVIISVYAQKETHLAMKKRAAELGMPVSQYLQQLAIRDLNAGGEFTMTSLNKKIAPALPPDGKK